MSRLTITAMAAVLISGILPARVAAQQVIFLMRHAEPMAPAGPASPDPALNEAGHRRAKLLAERLKDTHISAIYVTDTQRTRQTAEPAATALKLQPHVVGRQDIETLVARLRADHPRERVLVVNHALNLPGILKALGHPHETRVALDDFEPLFVVIPRPDSPPLVIFLRL